jgi:NitT/TauT family transport system substrate-binding protein
MDRRYLIFSIVILVAAGIFFLGAWSLAKPLSAVPPTAEPLTIGTSPFEVSGLIFIAEDQGFFEQNGISPRIKIFDAGINAMNALSAGEVDVATAADFVFARYGIDESPINGIATIGKSEFHYIIARKDRGIRNISDLKGKKIGVARGTSGEFFLGRFLQLHGINLRDVEIVGLPPAQLTDPLLNGTVDAVSTWDPYAYPIEKRLGDNALVIPDQKYQPMYWIVISRQDFVAGNQSRIQKFLSSLSQAEKFALEHPAEAKAIVQKRLGTDDAYMDRVWPNTHLSLSTDQSLITAMEDEARWLIANNLTNGTEVPDFREYIYTDGLNTVKPGSVHIIG